MMKPMRLLVGLVAIALACAGCAADRFQKVDQTSQGPTGMDVLTARSQVMNGRDPSFDEKRIWETRADMRIAKYLRDHPELEQSPRYMDVRFWRQVDDGIKQRRTEPGEGRDQGLERRRPASPARE